MHPARLSYLAGWNAPHVKVLSCESTPSGHTFSLECGHGSSMPPHFDASSVRERKCHECGRRLVATSPRWQHEFSRFGVFRVEEGERVRINTVKDKVEADRIARALHKACGGHYEVEGLPREE